MEAEGHPRAEEALRLLAAAANSARLYPPSSTLPLEAAERFARRGNEIAESLGPIRYIVEPHGFTVSDEPVAAGLSQVTQFAETLHALQVGQLILVPGITSRETVSFVATVLADPLLVRRAGGARSRLVLVGVEHLAVVEVTLRASDEGGLLGLDLTCAPLGDIGHETDAAVVRWHRTAQDGRGEDDIATAVARLEQATREVALSRLAESIMRLDEATRIRVLAWSLEADRDGRRMEGMLDVLARMRPAALARLLTIVAARVSTDPSHLARAIELPPETAREIGRLLAAPGRTDAESGVPPAIDHRAIAREASATSDSHGLAQQVAVAAPALASPKALTAAVAVSRRHPEVETVRAIATALPQSARDGAFEPTREALRRLDELTTDPALTESVAAARSTLADGRVLADVCRAPMRDSDAAIAGEILSAAGTTGAEVLVNFYDRADDEQRSLMRPVLRGLSEAVLGVANRRLRGKDALAAVVAVRTLPALGDRRAVNVLHDALQDVHTEVRLAAVRALADTPGPDARHALAQALNHWDPETQRLAIREIGRVRATEAVPAMVRALEDINLFRRNHYLRKEIVRSLAQVGAADALPVLRRLAGRFAIRRQSKELQLLAQRAILTIEQRPRKPDTDQEQRHGEPGRAS